MPHATKSFSVRLVDCNIVQNVFYLTALNFLIALIKIKV